MNKLITDYENNKRIKNLYPEEIINIITVYEPKRMIKYIQKIYFKWNWERTYKQMYDKESIKIAQFEDNDVKNQALITSYIIESEKKFFSKGKGICQIKWLNGLINRTKTIIVLGNYYKMKLKNGEVWATGDNDYGQLGIGNYKDQKIWVKSFAKEKVIKVVCGIWHTMIITEKGEVWATGDNYYGQLGIGNNENQKIWVKSFTKEKVIKVVCGECHTMIITEKGEVWATGLNNHGQLGIRNNVNQNVWVKSQIKEKVIKVVCGTWHTMIITEKGEVWATGHNYRGQLGIGNYENQNVWVKSFSKEKVIKVVCGIWHTMVLTEKGEVWATGHNQNVWDKKKRHKLTTEPVGNIIFPSD